MRPIVAEERSAAGTVVDSLAFNHSKHVPLGSIFGNSSILTDCYFYDQSTTIGIIC